MNGTPNDRDALNAASLCGPCSAGEHTGPGKGGICECACHRSAAKGMGLIDRWLTVLAFCQKYGTRIVINKLTELERTHV